MGQWVEGWRFFAQDESVGEVWFGVLAVGAMFLLITAYALYRLISWPFVAGWKWLKERW